MGPLECKLTIFKDGEGRRKVRYEVIPPSDPSIVRIEGDLCDDELKKDTVKRLNRFIGGKPDFCQHDDLKLIGLHLYHILFDGITSITLDDGTKTKTNKTLGEKFIETYQKSGTNLSDPDFRFRVTLIFEEGKDELAGYPWEFLYVPRPNETGFFLAGEKAELILTRFVPKLGTPLPKPAGEKLVILVAWSQPKELAPVVESDTVLAIKTLAEKIKDSLSGKKENIEVRELTQATHGDLKDRIENGQPPPNIVHFIGHGRVTGNEAEIALMKTRDQINLDKAKWLKEGVRGDPPEANWVNSDSMRALFIKEPPRVVFLHACNSDKAPPGSLEAFRSTAQQVLRANVPFVIAMQYEISNEDATSFAKTFYEKLGEGMSIDEAVKSGRNELGKKEPSWGHPRFGTPVVYLQSEDSVIVKKEVKEGGEGKDKSPVLMHKCPYDCDKIVSPDQKRCACEKKNRLKQCPKCGRANTIDAIECWYTKCDWTFDTKQSQVSAPKEVQRDRVADLDRGPKT
jgi:hypothetical protein